MSWDHQAYSFGNPNAQPPTPTQTPTSGVFSSATFQTPQVETATFDDHTGWTPTFAEEYSVFNTTPSCLTSIGGHFADISTPRPSTASSQRGSLSNTIELEAELASHVHHSVQRSLPLPPVDPLHQLSSSPRDLSAHGTRSEDKKSLITPRKPRRRLEEAFSGQTATPPQSAAKPSRKLAPKPRTGTMQPDQDHLQTSSGAPGLPNNNINFSIGSDSMFGYPMTAPATAPIFTNTKPFWDPDSGMSGMDMDLDFSTSNGTMFDPVMSHRINSSVDWGRSNHVFQDTVNMPAFNEDIIQASRNQRSISSKDSNANAGPNISDVDFGFGGSTMSEDPFAIVASSGAVDPGLLFAFPELNSSNVTGPELTPPVLSYSQPPPSLVREPYQHQRRESRRDREELRRSRSSRENSAAAQQEKNFLSSPAKKSSRPVLQRSASDSRTRVGPSWRTSQLSTIASRPLTAEAREEANRRRASPLKHQSRTSLSSIPESVSGTRTALTFSIDANGRARTETKIVTEEPLIMKRRLSSPISDEWASSQHSDSSTDEDPIILPSRKTSFNLPPKRLELPSLVRFDNSHQSAEERYQSIKAPQRIFSASGVFSGKGGLDEQESEAETVMEDQDGSGDAKAALRKVMESRKHGAIRREGSQHHFCSNNPNRTSASHSTPHKNNPPYYHSTTNLSPTTVSDPDLATPSTDRESSRSDSTRCICNNRDGDGFMIQCESCEKWLHAKCVGISRHRLPNVYICAFCAQTPNMRGGRMREPMRDAPQLGSSPLAHKSFKSWR